MTLAPPSLLVRLTAALLITGVVSLAVAVVPPLAVIVATLLIWVVPAGTAPAILTANVSLPVAPPARLPIVRVQIEPAGSPSAQLQAPELAAASKVVFAGTC